LPDAFTQPDPERYQQFLPHADSRQRFSIVSFVWGPGQSTPVHDPTVWGLIGVLRGAEIAHGYHITSDGILEEEGRQNASVPAQWTPCRRAKAISIA
jgi:predicted metal-dependent enzyme (double-stranded beta helix superfamily)